MYHVCTAGKAVRLVYSIVNCCVGVTTEKERRIKWNAGWWWSGITMKATPAISFNPLTNALVPCVRRFPHRFFLSVLQLLLQDIIYYQGILRSSIKWKCFASRINMMHMVECPIFFRSNVIFICYGTRYAIFISIPILVYLWITL